MDFQSIIVVPSSRYARTLDKLWQQTTRSEGLPLPVAAVQVSDAPIILTFDQWTLQLRDELFMRGYLSPRKLLTDFAEQTLWQQIIKKSEIGKTLLSTKLAASSAKKAYRLLRQWDISAVDNAFEFNSRPDSEAFLQWSQNFEKACLDKGYQSFADLHCNILHCCTEAKPADQLVERCNKNKAINAVGFVKPTPMQTKLFECFGANISMLDRSEFRCTYGTSHNSENKKKPCSDNSMPEVAVSRYSDVDQELMAAAHWAKKMQAKYPDREVAVVIPDLASQQTKIERIFRSVLEPASLELGRVSEGRGYNLSAGQAIATAPLINSGVDLLRSAVSGLEVDEWQRLLMSPYLFGCSTGSTDQIDIMKALYAASDRVVKFEEIPGLLDWYLQRERHKDADLNEGLRQQIVSAISEIEWASIQRGRAPTAVPSEWLLRFLGLLDRFHWGKSRVLNSEEYQQLKTFKASVAEFAQLDDLVEKVSAPGALQLFTDFLATVTFHRETPNRQKNIPSVYGTLEGAAVFVDHLWVVGVSHSQWPPSSKPNALLSLDFQRRLDMPGASHVFEREYSAGLTKQLLRCSDNIQLSYPAQIDGIDVSLAPIFESGLQALEEREIQEGCNADGKYLSIIRFDREGIDVSQIGDDACCAQKEKDQVSNTDQLVEFVEDTFGASIVGAAKAVGTADSEFTAAVRIRGGVGFLTQMANNPLRAYFEYRLDVKPLQKLPSGFSPQERGTVIHRVLERIWRQLENHDTLINIPLEEADELVWALVTAEVNVIAAKRFYQIPSSVVRMEMQQTQRLISTWLTVERERPVFSVAAFEQEISLAMCGISISGRLDRVDRLQDGSHLLLDYKTGRVTKTKLQTVPTTDPQLPFYLSAISSALGVSCKGSSDAESKVLKELQPVSGVGFACLKPGSMRFLGVSSAESSATSIAGIDEPPLDTWGNYFDNWHCDTQRLFEEIAEGFAGLEDGSDCSDDHYQPVLRSTF